MQKLIFQIIGSSLGLWLSVKFVPQVDFLGDWKELLFAGAILGGINFFIKPLLNIITLPLKILTFGIFGIVVNMFLVWIVDILFPQLSIQGIIPLFWTTLIVWGVNFILGVKK